MASAITSYLGIRQFLLAERTLLLIVLRIMLMPFQHPVRCFDLPYKLCKIRLCTTNDHLIQKILARKRSVGRLGSHPLELRISSGCCIKRDITKPF